MGGEAGSVVEEKGVPDTSVSALEREGLNPGGGQRCQVEQPLMLILVSGSDVNITFKLC